MAEKRQSRAQLEAVIAELTANVGRTREAFDVQRRELQDARNHEKLTRAQFADLKERLVNSELQDQFMRGYLTRVQEDDVVREELIQTGDMDGAIQLMPKRKPTHFPSPNNYAGEPGHDRFHGGGYMDATERKAPPRHWVTY